MVMVLPVARPRATRRLPEKTCETVVIDTPASRATSSMLAICSDPLMSASSYGSARTPRMSDPSRNPRPGGGPPILTTKRFVSTVDSTNDQDPVGEPGRHHGVRGRHAGAGRGGPARRLRAGGGAGPLQGRWLRVAPGRLSEMVPVTRMPAGTTRRNLALLEEGRRLVELGAGAGVTVRLLGGVAVLAHCPSALGAGGIREIADLDVVVGAGQGRALARLLTNAGYRPEQRFNALHGQRRMLFHGPLGQLDVLVGTFEIG